MSAPGGSAGARVEARGWGWRHAGRRAHALRALDLVIEPGERVLLLGASGSGKSTLLHGLAGILGGAEEGEQEGALLLDGRPASESRGSAGLVLQDPDTQAVLSRIGDDVAFGLENLGVPREEIAERIRPALDAVGLDVALDRSTSALSGGQKQRLALAGVLVMRPRLLLLDEPTANLDPEGVLEVRDAVERSLGDRTLVVVEHRVDIWWHLMTRVIVLGSSGEVVVDGDPDGVLARHRELLDEAGIWLPGRRPGAAAADAPPPADREVALEKPAGRPLLAPGTPLLTAAGLAVRRPGGPVAASGIDLRVAAGRALAITGPNGAGKSTLALTLAGLVRPESGRVTAEPALARHLDGSPLRWRSRDLLTRIGFVFQSPDHQLLAPTVRRELELGPRALGLGEAEVAAISEELLERLHLARLAAAHPFSLSGGEKRRLSVATVLATSPDVIVLDEPTFGQDARTWRELVALLREQLGEGRAVVAVTHDRELISALARGVDLGDGPGDSRLDEHRLPASAGVLT